MITLLLIIIVIEFLIIGIFVGRISKNYFVHEGDIFPKKCKIFYGYLDNATRHQFREIRYGKAKDGELVTGGGRDESCAVFKCDDIVHSFDIDRLVCELVD